MNEAIARLLSSRVESILIWSVETTLVACALALVAAFGDRWKRLGPAAKHALWLVILVKLMTPPVVQWPWSRPWSAPALAVVVAEPPRIVAEPPMQFDAAPINVSDDEAPAIFESEEAVEEATIPEVVEPPAPEPEPDPEPVRGLSIGHATRGLAGLWLLGSLVVAGVQLRRIIRFHLRARNGVAAPDWLVEETWAIADLMSVRAPSVRVVGGLPTPMVWCLGRPVLLVPEELVKTLGVDRWRCVLAHELAHLRRGDHWVSRLELIAGIAWWWNPVYWWARHRVDAEAELACDAWVVATLPRDRITFAESLIRICSAPSLARSPAPSVGVAGSGRDFERRLTMILSDRVSARPSLATMFAAALLAALAVPSWTMAKSAAPESGSGLPSATVSLTSLTDDDDDDDEKEQAKVKEQKERAEKAEKRAKARAEAAEKRAKAKAKKGEKKEKAETREEKTEVRVEEKVIEKSVEDAFGPEFEKKMEAFGAEMEKKFGPGSEFEKLTNDNASELQKQFSSGSEFEFE